MCSDALYSLTTSPYPLTSTGSGVQIIQARECWVAMRRSAV